jgi:hypothetical protein
MPKEGREALERQCRRRLRLLKRTASKAPLMREEIAVQGPEEIAVQGPKKFRFKD